MLPCFFRSPAGIQFLLSDHMLNPVVGKCHTVKGCRMQTGEETAVSQKTNELVYPVRSHPWRMAHSLLIEKKYNLGEIAKKKNNNKIKDFWLFFLSSLSWPMTHSGMFHSLTFSCIILMLSVGSLELAARETVCNWKFFQEKDFYQACQGNRSSTCWLFYVCRLWKNAKHQEIEWQLFLL